jgi:hypothetical protein
MSHGYDGYAGRVGGRLPESPPTVDIYGFCRRMTAALEEASFMFARSIPLPLSLCWLWIGATSVIAADGTSGKIPWSFRPLEAPAIPRVERTTWPQNDIDRFILARLEAAGLAPNAPASRHTLIRRVAFDLTGLPPTPEEVEAFLADRSPDYEAFARVVDAYLRSPRFGERWGRHWLDIVRYGDSTGRAWNAPLTYAWRYREYVIDSFNADKPLDQFVTEQLAGDLLPAKSLAQRREQLIATGMLALGAPDLQSLSHEQFVLDGIDDQIDVTTRALLGLSVACARCHDHKYDPVTMRDYYALAGIFYSTQILPGVAHQREFGREGYVHPSKLQVLPVSLKSKAVLPQRVSGIHSMGDYQDVWRQGERKIRFTTDPNLALGVRDDEPLDCAIRIQGEPTSRGDTPPRGDLEIAGLPRLEKIYDDESGRLQLARWIVSDDNPLTARVLSNRVWQHLFGVGLARTVDDFGINSEPPTHPELLDYLALQLREREWSIKQLIRSIVLSKTYQLSSAGQPAAQEKDPANELYWRMNRRRLELEPLRDSLLAVAGRLSNERPEGIQVAGIGGKSRLSQVASLLPFDSPYRTVYLPVIRAGLPEEYGTFDFPDPCLLQGQREVTTVAPQALFFMNGAFVVGCMRDAADELLESRLSSERERIDWAYQRTLQRPPTPEEAAEAATLVRSLQPSSGEADPERYRWATLIQALVSTAEFRYVR